MSFTTVHLPTTVSYHPRLLKLVLIKIKQISRLEAAWPQDCGVKKKFQLLTVSYVKGVSHVLSSFKSLALVKLWLFIGSGFHSKYNQATFA